MHPNNERAIADKSPGARAPRAVHPEISGDPFSIRLMPRERTLIAARAQAEGTSVGAFIRHAALTKCGRAPSKRVAQRDELSKLLAEGVGSLGRVASSSNQIARSANSGFLRDGEAAVALTRLERQLAEIREILLELGGGVA